ncbi:EF-P 5-aminopentanol modification-associated protein YfmH [Salisediminibacterium selenitireducens]|uniref:Peptidase M16 domain protein n=1 Tax=Bacillus selenitireducens (strain ATCC 700615 / DSM 15326 / MLS10) TaxID=439292 RepID=D6XU25_BACIE|nr:pitrilysin family protein [Salisediminibacterium selenitireducens]ADH99311.1 peptidase M16 domain protein [[Bacillus] selenitireducens MLS10]
MQTIRFEQLDETLYKETLPNGLEVFILPKPGFRKTFATFTAKYGSMDRSFTPIGQKDPMTVPDGIAHFLEHKMFEDEDGDVFQVFSKQGASANAFTSFTRTAYLFSSTSMVNENVETLLDFVQKPYFTSESVEKEKGIIGQEIRMYEDNPDWRNFFGLLKAMYQKHPVAIDIAGTVESIDEITADLLYSCYETFYHPANMALFIVGNVDQNEMMTLVRNNQNNKSFDRLEKTPRNLFTEEPAEVNQKTVTVEMPVQTGKVLLGIKDHRQELFGQDLLKYELAMEIVMDLLFGQSSENYSKLYRQGLIDDSFGYDFTHEEGFGFSVVGGDSEKPEVLAETLKSMLKEALEKGLDETSFERIRKQKLGQFLRSLNSPEFIANQFTRYHFLGIDLFEGVPALESLRFQEVEDIMKDHMDLENRLAVCFVLPEKER